jgi:hypothetical protein
MRKAASKIIAHGKALLLLVTPESRRTSEKHGEKKSLKILVFSSLRISPFAPWLRVKP